ncbi:Nif3-like dinuclear metal center hexameric protein [Mycoplasma sp. Mirounga ES2805-ORL]|uniref:Nif3-like dinuclear metal center hexameric protein n=1 Tax=Mycoplasma sp. Mirounga ES2805-ORL TaxID=754514 RepID=UPI00197B8504|nr:Nif3-like dinuclear metal center hexameric protein [Mycoplasma sp. Mirounga ES2805-ORL]QSF13781.1 Nif3-like dinuclear metal center hexameric protein [Mycoplasma sp. Mirounga ES2805-ORL]
MQLRRLTKYLLEKYPLEDKEDWDPSGFSVKFNLSEKITGIVVGIDLTKEVLDKAIETNSNLIITHHPFKWEDDWETEKINAPYKLDFLEILKEKRINVLCLHTNFDNQDDGTSYQIVKRLKLESNLVPFDDKYAKIIKWNKDIKSLIKLFNTNLNLYQFRSNFNEECFLQNNYNIGILAGSGPIDLANKLSSGYVDLVITSDIKWSDWINYRESKFKILEISHLDEQVFVYKIYEDLVNKFNNLKISTIFIDEPYHNVK